MLSPPAARCTGSSASVLTTFCFLTGETILMKEAVLLEKALALATV